MTLNLFAFTIEQIHDLDSQIDGQIDILVMEQVCIYAFVLFLH